ncbi:MAG: pseudouridine synthase [Candidatus Competibacterales bacterium]
MGAGDLKRVDQLLAGFGYCSRRQAKAWVKAGRVVAGGETIQDVARRVDPNHTLVDGAPVPFPRGLLVAFHKPLGVVCSHSFDDGPRIYDLLPSPWLARKPPPATVGRLDKDTTGLILITDVGALIQGFTAPRRKVAKVYQVTVDRPLDPPLSAIFAAGELLLQGEKTPCAPADLVITGLCQGQLTLFEGRYRQVRRMFAHFDYRVTALHRSHFGPYSLGDLAPGHHRPLTMPDSSLGIAPTG